MLLERAKLIAAHRHVLAEFLQRDIRTRYLGSLSGFLWLIVNPLAQLAIYAYVFVVIFEARVPEADAVGFVPFLAVAFWPWSAFADAVIRATTAIEDNAPLISKVALPHELFVLTAVISPFVMHMVGYAAVLIILAVAGIDLQWTWLPVAVGVLVLFFVLALGLGLIFSALEVFIRDLKHALPPLVMLLFFATPILYSPSLIPEPWRDLQTLSPLSWLVERLRDALLRGQWEWAAADLWVPALIFGLLYLGWHFFNRLSARFEDFL